MAGWLFAAVTWFCVNVEAQTNPVWMCATQWQAGSYMACSNLTQPAQFQPRDGCGTTTNIVISEQYHGTIQIGTNIYTRKDFADLAVIPKGNFGIWRANLDANAPKTNWLGSVITGERLGGGKPNGLLDTKASDEQIGLRSDGVVVWRKRE